jgi:hypothetical protein
MNISQHNVVCIMTRPQAGGLKNSGFYPSRGKRFFFSPKHPGQQWDTTSLGAEAEQLRCESDRSPSSSAEVKNVWNYTNILSNAFLACTGITLTLPLRLVHSAATSRL